MAGQSNSQDGSPLLNLPAELRTEIWKHCITNAEYVAEKITEFQRIRSAMYRCAVPKYLARRYEFRKDGFFMIGIKQKALTLLHLTKSVRKEVYDLLNKSLSLSFRGLDIWDFEFIKLAGMKSLLSIVEITLRIEDFEELGSLARDNLWYVFIWLDGLPDRARVYLNVDEKIVELLAKGDERLGPFAELRKSLRVKGLLAHCDKCGGCGKIWDVKWGSA